MFGFVKVAAAVPNVKVADCIYNKEQIVLKIEEASKKGVQILCFPELSITAYTCGDLFFQSSLLEGAKVALKEI